MGLRDARHHVDDLPARLFAVVGDQAVEARHRGREAGRARLVLDAHGVIGVEFAVLELQARLQRRAETFEREEDPGAEQVGLAVVDRDGSIRAPLHALGHRDDSEAQGRLDLRLGSLALVVQVDI